MPVTEAEDIQLIHLLEQEERERLSPKLEQIKTTDKRIIIVKGGRCSGAKSWGVASAIIQICNYERHRVACCREIQKSLTESVHQLIADTIDRLQYRNWIIRDDFIENTKTKAYIIFRGLKDLRAANQMKGLEGYDIVWNEEASTISDNSFRLQMPTIVRNPWWRMYITYNPDTEFDPCTLRFWNEDRPDTLKIRMEPGPKDNPWWNDDTQKEMEMDYARDPDEALHVWGGHPRKQGQNAVMSRVSIMGAMRREIEAKGVIEIGVDVARFGDDKTVMYKRHGLKIVGFREFAGQDTQRTAKEVWDMANHDSSIEIKVDDTGVGGGVVDRLREFGAKVRAVEFGGKPVDEGRFTSAADEMWFMLPIDEIQIPNDQKLMQQLSGRLYDYDHDRKKIESKKIYKARSGESPDRADALLLCFYHGGGLVMSADALKQMAARRAAGR